MSATLDVLRANVEASSDVIQGLAESIADAERAVRAMAETQEFLDGVRPSCSLSFHARRIYVSKEFT